MPQAPVLRNTCHGPRTSIPQRVGCLPPHTDRVQQDIRPTDSPAPSAQKSGNTTKGATSKPTENEDDPRAQHAAVGAWDNYVDPHPDGDKPRPRDPHEEEPRACPRPHGVHEPLSASTSCPNRHTQSSADVPQSYWLSRLLSTSPTWFCTPRLSGILQISQDRYVSVK